MKKGRPLAYTRITYEELGMFVGTKASIPVSKNWLDAITGGTEETISSNNESHTQPLNQENEPKIEYEITTFE